MFNSWKFLLFASVSALNLTDIRSDMEYKYKDCLKSGSCPHPPDTDYIARVVVVDMGYCDRAISRDQFYTGFVSSFVLDRFDKPGKERARAADTKIQVTTTSDIIISSTEGAVSLGKGTQTNFSWEWLAFGGDLRKGGVYFQAMHRGGTGFMYFPLLHFTDSHLGGSKAYMLEVYPDKKINPGPTNAIHHLNTLWYNPEHITGYGEKVKDWLQQTVRVSAGLTNLEDYHLEGIDKMFYSSTHYNQQTLEDYFDKNQYTMTYTHKGEPHNLCQGTIVKPTISFKEFKTLLRQTYNWL